jgi:hypothetical protein
MQSFVSLRNWLTSFYQSTLASYAPGIAAGFSGWLAVRGGDGVQASTVVYFGNSNGTSTGWRFQRLANVASSTPAPILVPFQIQIGDSAPALIVATARMPIALWIGRIHFFGFTMNDALNTLSLYMNGTRLTTGSAFAATLVPGASNLKYGVQSSDDCRDEVIGGAYSSFVGADLAEADRVHAAAFNSFKQQSGGKVMFNAITEAAEQTGVTIPLGTCYDSYSVRGPFQGTTPATLENSGSDGTAGDLTFNGAAVLQPQVDRSPDFSGSTLIP